MLTDKLFYWLFQSQPDRILALLQGLPADAAGYRFTAPVLKQREYRLDGLFLPPPERPDLPAVILEAQMAPDPGFLLRVYAESARFLQQEEWTQAWQVVVICPQRNLDFGDPSPVQEFVEQRIHWIELLPTHETKPQEPLAQALSLLVQPEPLLPALTASLRDQASSNPMAAEVLPLIPTILVTRFTNKPIQEVCAMGGITLEEFTQSRAYREIFGAGEAQGEARGEARGKAQEAAKVALLQLSRRCGALDATTSDRIQGLPLEQLEALADALLDFTELADLEAWLTRNP